MPTAAFALALAPEESFNSADRASDRDEPPFRLELVRAPLAAQAPASARPEAGKAPRRLPALTHRQRQGLAWVGGALEHEPCTYYVEGEVLRSLAGRGLVACELVAKGHERWSLTDAGDALLRMLVSIGKVDGARAEAAAPVRWVEYDEGYQGEQNDESWDVAAAEWGAS